MTSVYARIAPKMEKIAKVMFHIKRVFRNLNGSLLAISFCTGRRNKFRSRNYYYNRFAYLADKDEEQVGRTVVN